MRRNLFLHFLNRDTREIFGLYEQQEREPHARLMRNLLHAAILSCEDYCIAPPGFLLEDNIAFDLAESRTVFLERSLIRMPLREPSLEDYAEKKRISYAPMRDRYSGLYNDTRIDFLGRHARGLVDRKARITENIVRGWEAGADSNQRIWDGVKNSIEPQKIEIIRKIPKRLMESEIAATWSEINGDIPEVKPEARAKLRGALQNVYFTQYCEEFDLIVLSGIPFMVTEFSLPVYPRSYNYKRLTAFLHVWNLFPVLLDSRGELLANLKARSGLIEFMDCYVQLAERSETEADLITFGARGKALSKFKWDKLGSSQALLINPLSDLELLALDEALAEAASLMQCEFGLTRRGTAEPEVSQVPYEISGGGMADIVVFVALPEELDVLAKCLKLTRSSTGPEAQGQLGDFDVDVVSPLEMGRVPAAVRMTRYLERRSTNLPKIIVIIGLAGGFTSEGTKPGHIICADIVVDLASRKLTDQDGKAETKFRRKDYELNDSIKRVLMSDDFATDEWQQDAIENGDWPTDRRPSLHYGKVASGDEVVASDEWQDKLLNYTEKLLGIEMEGGGVCAAASRYKVPVCMVRAVSDNADPAKADDSWRKTGLLTLSTLLLKLPFGKVFEAMRD